MAGTLTKIVYPTKGIKEFQFESNDYGAINHYEITSYNEIEHMECIDIEDDCDELYDECNDTLTEIEVSIPYGQYVTCEYRFSSSSGQDIHRIIQISDSSNNIKWSKSFNDHVYEDGCYLLEGSDSLWLYKGTYTFEVTDNIGAFAYAQLKFRWDEITISDTTYEIYSQKTGGIRIKRILTYDSTFQDTLIKNFKYRLQDTPNRSSGVILSKPKYFICVNLDDEFVAPQEQTRYIKIFSNPIIPLGINRNFSNLRESEVL